MRLAFFGSGEFGLPTLEALVSRRHVVAAVVTQPDRPAGRGGVCRSTPIKALACELGLPVLTPETPNAPEFIEELRSIGPELAVVVAYGHLLKKPLLAVPGRGFVNLHASLLPAYRGAAPVPWAILNGETVSGASVFQLDERFDTGGVIGRVELPILPDDTSGVYLARLAPLGAEAMVRAVADIEAGVAVPVAQDNSLASRAPKLRKEDGRIDWTRPWAEISRQIRAFQPWPHAFTVLPTAKGGVRVNVIGAHVTAFAGENGQRPGQILAADAKEGLIVQTGDRPLRIAQLQPEGKRVMSDIQFLRGTCVPVPALIC